MRRAEQGRTSGTLEVAGDGALLTAATSGLATGVALLITEVLMQGGIPPWIEVITGILVPLGGLAGPVIAWRVHGRAINVTAVFGALLALPLTGVLFFAFVLVATALGWALSSVNDAEWFGPLIGAVIVMAAFVGMCVWLVVDAIRDRASVTSSHRRVDTARLVAATVVIVYSGAVVAFSLTPDNGEVAEALAFMLLAALLGGCALLTAQVMERLVARGGGPVIGAAADDAGETTSTE